MYDQLKALNSGQGADHGMKRYKDLGFSSKASRIPVASAELSNALTSYPLAFAPRQGGGYQLVALVGLHEGENLYLSEKNVWQRGYLPSYIRSYPFSLRLVEVDGEARGVLCFDHASGLYRESPDDTKGEVRFFDDEGELHPRFRQVWELLQATTASSLRTHLAVDALASAGLLIPWELQDENPDPERPLQSDLMRVDEAALNRMGGKSLRALVEIDALRIAYAQTFSAMHLRVLIKLFDLRYRQTKRPDAEPDTLRDFGVEEKLHFDWDNL